MAFLAPSIFWGKSPEDEVDILAVTQPRATTIYFDVIFGKPWLLLHKRL